MSPVCSATHVSQADCHEVAQSEAAVVLEAKLCGVGILCPAGEVLASEAPTTREMDSWGWMLREQVYRKWLSQSSQDRATAIPAQAIGEASATPAS